MEQHPVPQNVTTFQFRLIGDMTIKQFGYLASGVILAYISYKLPLPFFFTWPMTVIAAVGGFSFAFVPIEERPMDIWIAAFFKNVYSPTQYVWQKTKPTTQPTAGTASVKPTAPPATASPPTVTQPLIDPSQRAVPQFQPTIVSDQQGASFAASPVAKTPKKINNIHLGLPSFDFFSPWLSSLKDMATRLTFKNPEPFKGQTPLSVLPALHQKSTTSLRDVFANIKTPSVTGKRLGIDTQQQPLNVIKSEIKTQQEQKQTAATTKINKLESSLTQLQKELGSKATDQSHIVELQSQLSQVLSDKRQMEQELVSLRQHLTRPAQTNQVTRPAGVVAPPSPAQPSVRVIAAEGAVHAGLPKLTTFPNVVTGIIKDNLGNLLTGVLVTVRDKEDIPLRALKTNKLGQFAASTPLPNGTYVVEIEDPKGSYVFDRVQITLTGSLMPAIEIMARSQRQIAREKLAHEIFGNTNV